MSTAATLTGQRCGLRNETASPEGAASSPSARRSGGAKIEDVIVEPYGRPPDPSSAKGMTSSFPAVPAFGHVPCVSSPAMRKPGRSARWFGEVSRITRFRLGVRLATSRCPTPLRGDTTLDCVRDGRHGVQPTALTTSAHHQQIPTSRGEIDRSAGTVVGVDRRPAGIGPHQPRPLTAEGQQSDECLVEPRHAPVAVKAEPLTCMAVFTEHDTRKPHPIPAEQPRLRFDQRRMTTGA